jgi:hypothetical protein
LTSSDNDKEKAKKEKKAKDEKDKEKVDPEKDDGDQQSSTSEFAFLFGESAGQKKMKMDVLDARVGGSLWTRSFPEDVPAYWGNSQHGTLTFAWTLSSKTARGLVKSDPALSQRLSAMGDKEGDYLIQSLDLKTGKLLGQLLIETGKGAFRIDQIISAGTWVVVTDTENRILVYSLADGQLKQRFFGSRAAVSASDSLLCVENESGQLFIYDLNSGAKRDEFSFSSKISLVQFASGKRLFVVTANQTAYLLDVSGKSALAAARPN